MAIKKSIRLECKECKSINYLTEKNKKTHPDKLELKKFCNKCRLQTAHIETKKK
ncbi:MAG: 50S ribosomal protein L33 [Mycoplasmoidaceae bacterium]